MGGSSGCSCERFFRQKKKTMSQKDGKVAGEGEEVSLLPKSITPPKMETAGRLGQEGKKGGRGRETGIPKGDKKRNSVQRSRR